MKKILVTANLPGTEFSEFIAGRNYNISVLNELERKNLKKAVEKFSPDGMITLLSDVIDREIIDSAPDLKVISNYAAGYNNIDVKYCSQKNIVVTNTPDVLTDATADIAIMLMLMVSRRAVESERFTRSGFFKGWEPELFLGKSLYGKNLGILGLGRIGFATAKRAKAFGMNIFYWGRNRVSPEKEKEVSAKFCGFDELLEQSDFISLHLPYVPDLYHMIGEGQFNIMKKDAIIINTSRGQLIDESALATALKNKRIFGAGLDVYEFEPQINRSLFEIESCVLLPHIGSGTEETRAKMAEMALTSCLEVLNGGRPVNTVN